MLLAVFGKGCCVGVFDSPCFCVADVGGGVRVRVMLEVNAQSMQRCVHHCGSGRMGRRQGGVLLCCVQVVRNGPCHTAAWGTCLMLPKKRGDMSCADPEGAMRVCAA